MQKQIWTSLFFISAVFFLFFLVKTFLGVYPYYSLNSSVKGCVEEFSVKRLCYDRYAVSALYYYTVDGKEFEQEQILTTPVFLNPYAAQSHIDKYWKDNGWTVWYNKKAPYQASLQRLFPFKYFFNTLVLFFVSLYFYFLRKSAKKELLPQP